MSRSQAWTGAARWLGWLIALSEALECFFIQSSIVELAIQVSLAVVVVPSPLLFV